jgi:cyclase
MKQWTRRSVIAGGAAVTAGLALRLSAQKPSAPYGAGQPPVPSWSTGMREIAPDVFAYIQAGGPAIPYSGIANAGVLRGKDHLLAIDSLAAPIQTHALLAAAKRVAPALEFNRLVYSHHHGDHIDGAMYFPAGIDLISTEFCRQTIAAMAPLPPWTAREGWAVGGEPHLRLAPNVILGSKTTIDCGNIIAEVLPIGPAHTYGDILVYLPEKKVLFAGDVGFFYVAPYAHWGNIGNWIVELNRILDMDVTYIVPGHGPLGGKRELADQRDYLVLFLKEARSRFDAGMTPGRAASTITLGKFDAWRGAQDRLAMNTVRAFHEFSGTLTPQMDTKGTADAIEEYTRMTGYAPIS